MKTETSSKIQEYIRDHRQATAKELANFLKISPQALFRQLAKLQEKDIIKKIGRPPRVFYFIKEQTVKTDVALQAGLKKIIDAEYLIITPTGERKVGADGFVYWCHKTHQPIEKTAQEYVDTWKSCNKYRKNGLIDGTSKLNSTFQNTFLDKLFYIDFYSIERFGKTKLGQLLLYGKQSQNKKMIQEIIDLVQPYLTDLVKKYNIDGIGFIPPTVKREVQFMTVLERELQLKAHIIPIIKLKTEVVVPQKTLNKLEDRIENAQKTIIVQANAQYKNILLIDDAVGSGATLNETAQQIRVNGICSGKIIGLALTGSFKGFDVISEV